ncbi:hypothetical protein [Paenibacillus jilunlii]|uniref:Butirosin biosynthesis protein H, N-terminal n=2 Tax=Paenibacillus jilunlii TaxID=682956 RepID=A0A1G9M6G1_9BACL|nr:hypothetical protein [Paenibacillus jilunlii]SDL69788.1 hypothetical protein SAMN05216191_1059 [Paenibacillus jilunlii]
MRKMLPLHLSTGITHDCWHVYRLAPLMTEERLKPWFMERFIELEMGFSLGAPIDQFWVQYYRLEYYDMNWFYGRMLDTDTVIPGRSEFCSFTKEAIDRNNYVLIACDHYYLEQTPQYQKDHVIHEFLICGYDSLRCIWYVLILLNDNWSVREIPFEQLETAFDCAIKQVRDDRKAYRWLGRFEMPYTLIRLKSPPVQPVRLYKIYESIENSLAGAERKIKERTPEGGELHCLEWTGISIYQGFAELARTILYEHPSLLMEKHILLGMKKFVENKSGFLTRLRYLQNLALIKTNDRLLNQAALVIDCLNDSYFWMSKYYFSGLNHHLDRMTEMLLKAEAVDVPVLEEALEAVGTGLDSQYEETAGSLHED